MGGNLKIHVFLILFSQLVYVAVSFAKEIQTETGAGQIESIIVTAERQETDLQKTPISITAFTSEDIHNLGITEVAQLASHVPGLTMGNTGNSAFPEIYMRGIGTRDFSIGSDLSIGIYIDDVYMGRGGSVITELYDIERIEILKGPQATLWGRNTIAGAINVITKEPSNQFSTEHSVQIGNFDLLRFAGTLNGSLIGDKLLGKFSYNVHDREGHIDNVFSNTEVGDTENISIRGSLKYLISEQGDFTLNVDYGRDRPTSIAAKPVITGQPVLFGLVGNITVLDPPFNHIEPDGTFTVNQDVSSIEDRDIMGISGEFNWNFESFSFNSITSYREFELDTFTDTDSISIQLLNFVETLDQKQFSQEFRFYNQANEKLQWQAGLYYFHENSKDSITLELQDLSLLLGPGDYSSTNQSKNILDSYSIYGQLTYPLMDNLNLVLGLRFTHENKEFDIIHINNDVSGILDPSFPLTILEDSWNAFTPKVSIAYQQTDDLLYYASISRGFRSGGYNSLQTTVQTDAFDPEYITAYEAGLKSSWYNRQLQVNLALFYNDHTDLQVITLPSGSVQAITTNAADSDVMGIELMLSAIPFEGFQVKSELAYIDAEFKEFVNADNIDVSGNRINHTPEFSANTSLIYTFPIKKYGSVSIVGEHQYQSEIFFTERNEQLLSQDSFHKINARLEFSSQAEHISVALFGENLTDEETVNTGVDLRGELGVVDYIYDLPRTYGVELSYKY